MDGIFAFLGTVINQNTLGALVLAAFFTILGIFLKGLMENNGNIAVAKINSETTLGAKAMETLTTALEVLQEENKSLKSNVKQLEGHIDRLIDLILLLVKAKSQDEVDHAVSKLEQFLKTIGKWPY